MKLDQISEQNMKVRFVCALLLLPAVLMAQKVPRGKALMQAIVKSEMVRHPEAWTIDHPSKPKWNYTQGLELQAMRGCMPDEEWVRYVRTYVDALVDSTGAIKGYKMEAYKLDDVNSGKLLLPLYDLTGDERYRVAIETLMEQLRRQPRCPERGFWHKQIYPQQMWLDGLYMAMPFYTTYALRFMDGYDRKEVLADIEYQFELIYHHTLCEGCGLLHHAWDAAAVQPWADKETGMSAHAWGRAEGWYLMALVDVLEQIDCNTLKIILKDLSSKLLKLQHEETGTWQQVLDMSGMEGNYQEMTCTAMFAYAFLKGHRLGVLDKRFKVAAEKALEGMRKHYMSVDSDGLITLHQCCAVAGLSESRDGSFEYYLSEPRVDNDPKGIGPLLMALKEHERVR